MRLQTVRHAGGEGDVPPGGAALEPLSLAVVELLADQDARVPFQLDVSPLEPDRLRDSQAGVRGELEEQPPVVREGREQGAQLFARQRLCVVICGRYEPPCLDADASDWIGAYEAILDRRSEHRRQGGAQAADARRGQVGGAQVRIERSNVLRLDLGELPPRQRPSA